jgi:hypothetical protein
MTYFLAFAALAVALLVFTLERGAWWRIGAAAGVLVTQAGIISLALGYPLPWWAERGCMRAAAEPTVLGGSADEDAGKIFLTLQSPECGEPRLYWIPYSHKTAEALAKAQRESAERGTGVSIKRPFELSHDGLPPLPYAAPQPALPPKTEMMDQPA